MGSRNKTLFTAKDATGAKEKIKGKTTGEFLTLHLQEFCFSFAPVASFAVKCFFQVLVLLRLRKSLD